MAYKIKYQKQAVLDAARLQKAEPNALKKTVETGSRTAKETLSKTYTLVLLKPRVGQGDQTSNGGPEVTDKEHEEVE